MPYTFYKMHGAGNDFVVIDARNTPLSLNEDGVRMLAARSNAATKGCDQLIILEPSTNAGVFMRIYNADGSQVDACGNATRCVGDILLREHSKQTSVSIETKAGVLHCCVSNNAFFDANATVITASMGAPRFEWKDIPLSKNYTQEELKNIAQHYGVSDCVGAMCIGMGNPHVVFFTKDAPADSKLVEFLGKKLPNHPLFMNDGVNVTLASASNPEMIIAYVYERGAGLTKSCGTAACATAVAAVQLGLRAKDADIHIQQRQIVPLDLFIRWESKNNTVQLIGPVETEFTSSVKL
jgi:diaminopimelate epimerase